MLLNIPKRNTAAASVALYATFPGAVILSIAIALMMAYVRLTEPYPDLVWVIYGIVAVLGGSFIWASIVTRIIKIRFHQNWTDHKIKPSKLLLVWVGSFVLVIVEVFIMLMALSLAVITISKSIGFHGFGLMVGESWG